MGSCPPPPPPCHRALELLSVLLLLAAPGPKSPPVGSLHGLPGTARGDRAGGLTELLLCPESTAAEVRCDPCPQKAHAWAWNVNKGVGLGQAEWQTRSRPLPRPDQIWPFPRPATVRRSQPLYSPRVPLGQGLSTSMPCWVAGHWTRRTSLGSQKSSGDTCRLGAGGRRVLGAGAVAGGRSGPSWLMAPTGCVVRGTRRSGVVAAGEAVLVRGVGRAVVVVLTGGEVAGPGSEEGIQGRVTPVPGVLPWCAQARGLWHSSMFSKVGGCPGPHWVWENSPGLSLPPRPPETSKGSKNPLECTLRCERATRERRPGRGCHNTATCHSRSPLRPL